MSLLQTEAFNYLGVILEFNLHFIVSNASKSECIKCAECCSLLFFFPETALSTCMQLA